MPEPTPSPPRKRLGWLRREGIDLGDAAVQFIAVVIGIVLGLFISQWVSHRQQQATVHKAMQAIRAELVVNRAMLHKNVAHWHKHVVQMLDAAENHKRLKLSPRSCYRWPGWNGTNTESAQLTDAAYQTAIATQAMAHMPFRQAHRVARIYGAQQKSQSVQTFFLRHFIFSGQHTLGMCIGFMESFDRNYSHLSAAYSPLIGADHTKWPMPPHIPTDLYNPSK